MVDDVQVLGTQAMQFRLLHIRVIEVISKFQLAKATDWATRVVSSTGFMM